MSPSLKGLGRERQTPTTPGAPLLEAEALRFSYAVMRGGRVLEQGDTAAVFRAPAAPYTAELPNAATGVTRVAEPLLAAK